MVRRSGLKAVFRGGAMGLALMILSGGAGVAGEAQDKLFALGALKDLGTGEVLVYDFARTGAFPTDKLPVVEQGAARLEMRAAAAGGREVIVALDDKVGDTKKAEEFDPFPSDAGNPVFMVFMEQNVNAMATLTGGSPFYIRNRMREALGAQDNITPVDVHFDGKVVPGRQLTFRPFEKDANRDKMGVFSELEIRFVMSDAVPGGFASMEAVTPPGPDNAPTFRQAFEFDRVEQEK